MTEEQYIELTEYKDILYTATQRNYVMFGTLERKRKLSALYAATILLNSVSNAEPAVGVTFTFLSSTNFVPSADR